MTDQVLTAQCLKFQAFGVASLTWVGDTLIDRVRGNRFDLDGHSETCGSNFAYPFDSVISNGDDAIIYARFGTKALVLRDGEILREINRSYYFADTYDYPVALLRGPDGRKIIAHCPDSYRQLDFEDFKTGKRLTKSPSRQPDDFFHSRLSVSPDGRYLMSAGWVWHPMDQVNIYDVAEGLTSPAHLDGPGLGEGIWGDNVSACWTRDSRLIFGVSPDEDDEEAPRPEMRFYDVAADLTRTLPVAGPVGQIMPVGENYLLNLYDHPKLLDLRTGAVVQAWPEIPCGRRTSSVCIPKPDFMPSVALDPQNGRCAIGTKEEIFVLMFD